jgi:hypothetical protein
VLATVFSPARALDATPPEAEKPAANWTAALQAWLQASFQALSHAWPELLEL